MTPDSHSSDPSAALAARPSQARRQFMRCLAGAACAPLSAKLGANEIDIPQDARQIRNSPTPPWERPNSRSALPKGKADWPQPVVEVNTEADIPLASAIINTAGQGTWLWGAGSFRIPSVTEHHTALYFANLTRFRMQGQGPERTRLLQDDPPRSVINQLRLCAFENIGHLELADFAMDGQRSRYVLPDTPATGEEIHWQNADPDRYLLHNNREAMNNLFMRNVGSGKLSGLRNISARGDFVNLANVSNLHIQDCDIADCGRNGITLGGERGLEWSRNIEISQCRFHGNIDTQMIDLELHGSLQATPAQFNRNLYIHDCIFDAYQTDDDIDRDQFAMVLYAVIDYRVERCEINGPVMVRNGHGRFDDNTGGITQLTVDRYSRAAFRRTRFELEPCMRVGNETGNGMLVIRRDDTSPLAFSMEDCDVASQGLDTQLAIHDCEQVLLRGNRFTSDRGAARLLMDARESSISARISDNDGLGPPRIHESNGHTVMLANRRG